jgi:hypothetical protein
MRAHLATVPCSLRAGSVLSFIEAHIGATVYAYRSARNTDRRDLVIRVVASSQ